MTDTLKLLSNTCTNALNKQYTNLALSSHRITTSIFSKYELFIAKTHRSKHIEKIGLTGRFGSRERRSGVSPAEIVS